MFMLCIAPHISVTTSFSNFVSESAVIFLGTPTTKNRLSRASAICMLVEAVSGIACAYFVKLSIIKESYASTAVKIHKHVFHGFVRKVVSLKDCIHIYFLDNCHNLLMNFCLLLS